MAFPTYSVGTITELAESASHKVKMPNTVASGDRLVAVGAFSPELHTADFSVPSGWSAFYVLGYTSPNPDHGTCTLGIFIKVASGGEGGKSFAFDTSVTTESAWVSHRIQNVVTYYRGEQRAWNEIVARTDPTPDDATAASRGSQDYLVMSTYARKSSVWSAGYGPATGYTLGKHAESLSGVVQAATAFINFTGSQQSDGYWNNSSAPNYVPTCQVQLVFSTIP